MTTKTRDPSPIDAISAMARQFESDEAAEDAVSQRAEELAQDDFESASHFVFTPHNGYKPRPAFMCMECGTEISIGSAIIIHMDQSGGVLEEWMHCSHCFLDQRTDYHTRELLERGGR